MQVFASNTAGRSGNADGLPRQQGIRLANPRERYMTVNTQQFIAMINLDIDTKYRVITGLFDHAIQHTKNGIIARG